MPKLSKNTLRKAPTPKTLKQLFSLSANQCANPSCDNLIVGQNGTVVGRVCHITGAEKLGPRFDKSAGSEQTRAFENLILLCANCHVVIDDDEKKFPTKRLRKWKADHERRFAAIGERLQSAYLDTITDEAQISSVSLPKTFAAFSNFLRAQGDHCDIDAGASKEVERYVDNLKNVTTNDRQLMKAIIEKSFTLESARHYSHGVSVHPEDLQTILINSRRLTTYRLGKLGEKLDRNKLGSLDPNGADTVVYIASPHNDLGWNDLQDFLESIDMTLDALLVDMKFGILD